MSDNGQVVEFGFVDQYLAAADEKARLNDPEVITKELRTQRGRQVRDWWQVAALLNAAFETQAPAHSGYETFTDYVEEVTGFSYRTAQRFLRIWRWRTRLDVDTKLLRRIGVLPWNRLDVIVGVANPEDPDAVEQWVSDAETKSVRQLRALASPPEEEEQGGDDGGETEDDGGIQTMKFAFPADQAAIVEKAIETATGIADAGGRGLNRSTALVMICTDFLANSTDVVRSRDQYVTYLADLIGMDADWLFSLIRG